MKFLRFRRDTSRAIPIEPPPERAASFPLVGPALVVLTLHGILSTLGAPSLLGSVLAIAAAFATGYCALALVAGGRVSMSSSEILAFTIGLTILVTAVSALAVSVVGIPITQFVVVFIGLPLGVIAFLTRLPAERVPKVLVDFLRTWFDFSDYSRSEKGIAAVLLAAIIVALGVFISLAGVHYPDESSMGIAITGSNGSPDIPANFARGVPQTIEVYVLANSTPGPDPFTVRIRLVAANATGNESFHPASGVDPLRLDAFAEYREENVVVASGATRMFEYSIALDVVGDFTLRFELVTAGDVVLVATHLSLVVTS